MIIGVSSVRHLSLRIGYHYVASKFEPTANVSEPGALYFDVKDRLEILAPRTDP